MSSKKTRGELRKQDCVVGDVSGSGCGFTGGRCWKIG